MASTSRLTQFSFPPEPPPPPPPFSHSDGTNGSNFYYEQIKMMFNNELYSNLLTFVWTERIAQFETSVSMNQLTHKANIHIIVWFCILEQLGSRISSKPTGASIGISAMSCLRLEWGCSIRIGWFPSSWNSLPSCTPIIQILTQVFSELDAQVTAGVWNFK